MSFCAPFSACPDLDGRVLFQRSAYGPTLVNDAGPLSFAELPLQGAALRPYVDLQFEVTWLPGDLCYGPIASVMTLAPAERVTVATRSEHRTSFTDMMRQATEGPSVSVHTRDGLGGGTGPAMPASAAYGGAGQPSSGGGVGGVGVPVSAGDGGGRATALGGGGGGGSGGSGTPTATDQSQAIELRPLYATAYGSWLSDLGDAFAAVLTGGASLVAGAVAKGVSDVVKNGVGSSGSAGPAVSSTGRAIGETVGSVARRESQSHLSETTHSTESAITTSVTRTFANPYRDRTLELRFIPVFRSFTVATNLVAATPGLAMVCGPLDFSTVNVGSRYAHVLASAIPGPALQRLVQADVGVQASDFRAASGALQDHLQANAGVYTKQFLAAAMQARDEATVHGAFAQLLSRNAADSATAAQISGGLAWAESEVRANVVHVPLASIDYVRAAWQLDGAGDQQLVDALSQIAPDVLGSIPASSGPQTVNLYAGSHIEATAGQCTLAGIISDPLSVPPAPAE